mmetsp:Transcript_9095/g.27327  ORF Transcript_9095/g.27327 Transcript_9095/m.27327 type:complete len:272 (-) Transcript_9095:1490-2305(-)
MISRLCRPEELDNAPDQRLEKTIFGKRIVVLRHNGKVYAMDSLCSHMGFALGMKGYVEDIEDAAGSVQSCIRCPAHGRKFDLVTGRQISQDLQGKFCVSAPEQRMHPVYDPHSTNDGWWWVDLRDQPAVASDRFNVVQLDTSERETRQAQAWQEEEEIMSSSQESSASACLEPYAGSERRRSQSSPVRHVGARPLQQQIGFQAHLGFPSSKLVAQVDTVAAKRRAERQEAMEKRRICPPVVPPAGGLRQASLNHFFSSQPHSPMPMGMETS